MDAESTYVVRGFSRRTRLRPLTDSDGDIERLRSEMLRAEDGIITNIKNIRTRFSPENISELLVSTVREELFRRIGTMKTEKTGKAGYDMLIDTMETAKKYPAITALIGLGISWFLADSFLKEKTDGRLIEQMQEKVAQAEEQAREFAESNIARLKESAKDTDEVVTRKSRSVLEGVSDYVQEKLPRMKESAKETGEVIALKSQSVLEGVSSYVNENPLTSGFIVFSAGLALGIFTSGFFRSDGLLEQTKKEVQKKAGEMLHETREKAGQFADEARQAADMS